jgi:MoaA/NifB/PqqE/SkfB family radical SAM enzyme
MEKKILIPKRLTLETVFGCNSNCIMCVINLPTKRKKGIMPVWMSKYVLDECAKYVDQIRQLDFFGLGEPFLDPYLFERIKYAKEKGFKNIGISTNADLLDEDKQKKLLESGIDTVLFSIDGAKKETHEAIRRGTNFERVVRNFQGIIKMRDEGNYKTRFVLRFIRQDINKNEWEDFKKFWEPKLSKEKKDMMIIYDMHTWGGEKFSKDKILNNQTRDPEIEKKPCHRLNELLIVLADGSVPLCNEDELHAKFQRQKPD